MQIYYYLNISFLLFSHGKIKGFIKMLDYLVYPTNKELKIIVKFPKLNNLSYLSLSSKIHYISKSSDDKFF